MSDPSAPFNVRLAVLPCDTCGERIAVTVRDDIGPPERVWCQEHDAACEVCGVRMPSADVGESECDACFEVRARGTK